MSITVELHPDKRTVQDLNKVFNHTIEPLRSSLWSYCLMMTGSPWDADDLVQETLTKTYLLLDQQGPMSLPKAYLYKMASNAWVDWRRKQKFTPENYKDVDEIEETPAYDQADLEEAIEFLLEHLTFKQCVIFLLMEAFQYTATEVAEMIGSTKGAVKAALHRARGRVESMAKGDTSVSDKRSAKKVDYTVAKAFVEAFYKYDPQAIALLLNDHENLDMLPAVQYSKEPKPSKPTKVSSKTFNLSYLSSNILQAAS